MGAMTDLRTRPLPSASVSRSVRADAEAGSAAPISVIAVVCAVGALIAGMVPIAGLTTLTWLTSTWDGGAGSAGGAARTGLLIWLAAHRVPVTLAGATVTLAPLGLTAGLFAVLVAAGRQVARRCALRRPQDAAKASLFLAVAYAVGLGLVGLLSRSDGFGAALPLAPVAGFVLAAVAGGIGVCWQAVDQRRAITARVPSVVRGSLVGGLGGAAAMSVLGAALLVAGLLGHGDRVSALMGVYDGGWFSHAMLIALCVVLGPNAALFGAAYLLGPGFALGAGTLVSPMVVDLGPMPNIPLLGALPSEGYPSVTMAAAYGAPVLAGLVAVACAARWDGRRGRDWRDEVVELAALRGALAGVWAGLVVTALIALAGGSLGDFRLAVLGAPLLPTLALSVAWFGLTGAVAGSVWWLVGYRRRSRS